jgi:sigma-54 specific flagellar transcriptional regulator A
MTTDEIQPIVQVAQADAILVTALGGTRQYLSDVLQFIDCQVHNVADTGQFNALLQQQSDNTRIVFIGTSLSVKERNAYLHLIGQTELRPALIQICEDYADDVFLGSDFLGALQIPAQYEAIMSLLHKAQVFDEYQRRSEDTRRPLELFRSLSGNSRATQRINRMIGQVADSEATVLILGESGTGKEVVARKLHYHSKRRGRSFVPINCGAIPPDLLESELFGHEKGAFTGAISARRGRFEMAEGGTLFLDEIGDMSMHMQVKLLRVLQERTFERVGSNKTMHCNVRIVAATHRNLEKAIKEGKFREDLYYRLNVFPIDVAPLRERVEDIPVLVNDLIARIEHEKRGSVRLTPAAVTALTHYSWPGNVRELANLIDRLAILFPYDVVDVTDLPEKFRLSMGLPTTSVEHTAMPETSAAAGSEITMGAPRLPPKGINLKKHLADIEQSLIRQALNESDGVVAHAAKRLQIRRTTLVEKLRKYGLQRTGE